RKLGITRRSSGGAATRARFRRNRDHRGIATLFEAASRDSCAANRALRLGRTLRARSTRDRGDRLAANDALRIGIGEEAFLSARLCRAAGGQWIGAWYRYG